jgi:hypothetical protein
MPFIAVLSRVIACLQVATVVLAASARGQEKTFPSTTSLHKVYHEQIFSQHALPGASVSLLAKSHLEEAWRDNASQPLPFLGCGPRGGRKEAQARALLDQDIDLDLEPGGGGLVHVARDRAAGSGSGSVSEGETCLLLLASPRHILQLTRCSLPLSHMYTYTYMYTNMHKHMYMYTNTNMHKHMCTNMHKHHHVVRLR